MNNPVISALLPVVLLIAIGFMAGRMGWVRAQATKDLSTLVFMVLTPALLFRTMSTVHVQELNFKPVLMYFVASALLFGLMLVWQGATRRATVLALAATFSNTVMIGVPLIGLAYGQAGWIIWCFWCSRRWCLNWLWHASWRHPPAPVGSTCG